MLRYWSSACSQCPFCLVLKGRDRAEPVCRPVKSKTHSYEMTLPGAYNSLSTYHGGALEAGGLLRGSTRHWVRYSEQRLNGDRSVIYLQGKCSYIREDTVHTGRPTYKH